MRSGFRGPHGFELLDERGELEGLAFRSTVRGTFPTLAEVDVLAAVDKISPMTLTQFPALQRLSKQKKLQLAEELWCAAVDDSAPVSAEHRALLDSRWKAYRAGKVKRISLAELERRLARK